MRAARPGKPGRQTTGASSRTPHVADRARCRRLLVSPHPWALAICGIMVDALPGHASVEAIRLWSSSDRCRGFCRGRAANARAESGPANAAPGVVAVPTAGAFTRALTGRESGAVDLARLPLRHRHLRLRFQQDARLHRNRHQGLRAAVHRVRYFRGNEAPSDSISDPASGEPGRRRSRHHQDRPSHRLRIRQASHFRLSHEPRRHALQAKPLHNLDHHPVKGFVAPASRRLSS